MKLALLGYGKMGKMVEQAAERDRIEIVCVIDPIAGSRGNLSNADVCVDFTEPGVVMENIRTAAAARVPMVVGTTGWYDRLNEARQVVAESGIGLVYGSNFSVGVNLMFKITRYAAELFSHFATHDPFLEEAHHKFKKDAPSGTALTLKGIVEAEYGRDVPTSSTRAGYFPGKHTLGFDSEADTLEISHTARSRAGFAEGALLAAKWIATRQGFVEFSEIIEELLKGRA
ncbi:MAG TPA: dihydrodipicolinate reductase C-terminal domain-containing protein [Blastocatellia bacterium]|nr:dihydrodipicolinate reductase C-terminal domain-containing protein [Blastocatellia bacterium]